MSTWRNPGGAALVRGDACAIPLGDNTVDLIVTSPPYFALRSYQDGGEHYDGQIGSEATPTAFLEALWAVTAECWRVLKPTGSLFVNLGDKYAGSGGHNNSGIGGEGRGPSSYNKSSAVGLAETETFKTGARDGHRRSRPSAVPGVRAKSLMGLPWRYAIGCIDGKADPEGRGWVLRSEIIWAKPNGLPESVTDRVRRSHEQWFHLTKEGRYFANVDPIREAYSEASHERATYPCDKAMSARMKGSPIDKRDAATPGWQPSPLGKLPDSVWTIATQPLVIPEWLGVDHFAAFPTEWPRKLILGWCPEDGTVLDPFGGTGTTAMVAKALGRYGISVDLSADYLKLARWRVFDSGHADKAIARTNTEAQLDIFDTLNGPQIVEEAGRPAAALDTPETVAAVAVSGEPAPTTKDTPDA